MKVKILSVLLTAALTLTIAGCASNTDKPAEIEVSETPETAKDTPVRVRGNVLIQFEREYTLKDAVHEADIIVDATIVEWLGEGLIADDSSTYFSAKINYTLKGEEYETIILKQDGNSILVFENDPLYRNGDRMILFLKKMDYDKEWEENKWKPAKRYENAFTIVGGYQTPLIVQERDNQTFLFSRFDVHSSVALSLKSDSKIKKVDDVIQSQILEDYIRNDPLAVECILEDAKRSGFAAENIEDYLFEHNQKSEWKAESLYELLKWYPNFLNLYRLENVYDYNSAVERIVEISKGD